MQKPKKIWISFLVVLVISLLVVSSAAAKTEQGYDWARDTAANPELLGSPSLEAYLVPGGAVGGTSYCNNVIHCPADTTGRWIITYLREGDGHWVTWCKLYVPEFIDNELDAQNWHWSDDVLADLCSLEDEPQTWQGTYMNLQKETKPGKCFDFGDPA